MMNTMPNQVVCKMFKSTVSGNYEQVKESTLPVAFMGTKLSNETTTTDTSGPVPKLVTNLTIGIENELSFAFGDMIEIDKHKWRISNIEIKPNAKNKMLNVTILKLQRG